MILSLLFSLLVIYVMGYLFVSRFMVVPVLISSHPARDKQNESSWICICRNFHEAMFRLEKCIFKFCIALGAGISFSSILYTMLLFCAKTHVHWCLIIEILCTGILAWIHFRKPQTSDKSFMQLERTDFRWFDAVIPAIWLILFFYFIWIIFRLALIQPHGDVDAWATWNLHARFMSRIPSEWENLFLLKDFHLDYPLLLPGFIARLWLGSPQDGTWIPQGASLLFPVLSVLLLYSSLALVKNRLWASLASIMLLSTPYFMDRAPAQCADIFLSYLILASLVLLFMADTYRQHFLFLLGGWMAACAAWAKNEGMLFLVLTTLGVFFLVQENKRRGNKTEIMNWLAGTLPVGLVILYFKIRYAPSNPMVNQNPEILMQKFCSWERYSLVFRTVMSTFLEWGRGYIPLLILTMGMWGIDASRLRSRYYCLSAMTIGMMFIVYMIILIVSPFPLGWHIFTSWKRLVLQLWPATLWLIFLALKSDEK
ncbi:MAG: hypothetical protein JW774_00945 [Candidatus Aureabacteria bacterium]|nr:hypothetical protein [Candidatus Auribacterota bacterium]